jgi:hypothetical protein
MLKNKWVILLGLLLAVSFSSCGLFRPSCKCPKFGTSKISHRLAGSTAS